MRPGLAWTAFRASSGASGFSGRLIIERWAVARVRSHSFDYSRLFESTKVHRLTEAFGRPEIGMTSTYEVQGMFGR